MSTITIVIFFLIFTNIFAISPKCKKKTYCKCAMDIVSDIRVVINTKIGVRFRLRVKAWSGLQIDCRDIEWENFTFKRRYVREKVNLVNIRNCSLPEEETSLKDVLETIGIYGTNELIFQSHKHYGKRIKKEPLKGLLNVTKLTLSFNDVTEVPYHFFNNCTKLEYIDLSENPFPLSTYLFQDTYNLRELYLNGNELTELPPNVFDNLQYLEILSIERNLMEHLNEKIFIKLYSLKYLSLASNLLMDLPEKIFYNLKKIEIINLASNYFKSLSSKLFSQNKKLQKVLLNDNKANLTTLPNQFLTYLQKLEEVHTRKNELKSIPENIFWYSESLKYIDLSENYLETLPKFIFLELTGIEYISLSHNMIETFPVAIFQYLQKLLVLDLSFNRMGYVPSNLFEDLISLKELNMEGNLLKYVEKGAFFTNKALTIAKFSNNLLEFNYTNDEMSSPFYHNYRLKELYLSNNRIKHIFTDWSLNKKYLQLLDLSYNNISTVSANQLIFSFDEVLVDLRYNKISNIFLNDIERLAMHNTKKRKVVVHVDYNPLLCNCNLYKFLRYKKHDMPFTVYNFFKIKLGKLRCLQSNGTEGPQIKQLDFKTYQCLENDYFKIEKYCPINCTCYIRPYDKTRIYDCSYKNLTVFYVDKMKINFLKRYPLILNLTGNYLTELPNIDTLIPINITDLLLSNNNISEVSLTKLPRSLRVLELHDNNISSLNRIVIFYLMRQSLTKLTLSRNPFTCDCYAKHLLKFVVLIQYSYKDLENVKCKDKHVALRNMTSIELCIHTSIVLRKKKHT